MTTDVVAVLEAINALMVGDITAAHGAPQPYARRAMHSYAAEQLCHALHAALGLLPESDRQMWLALHREAAEGVAVEV